ncbi:MAG: transposase [Pirellulaceae bacterium]|nr:transposase [Pirellulaceae bacterium]
MYAKGMTTRDIQEIVRDLYGVDISPTLVSEITSDLDTEVSAWRTRLLKRYGQCVFRRHRRSCPWYQWPDGHQTHDLCGFGRQFTRTQRTAGTVAGAKRRCQVLVVLFDGSSQSGLERYLRGEH